MKTTQDPLSGNRHWIATLIAYIVAVHGFVIIMTPLVFISLADRQLHVYPGRFLFDAQLLFAVTLIYLSVLLYRHKRTAWMVTIGVYLGLMALSTDHLFDAHLPFVQFMVSGVRDVTVPLLIVCGLLLARKEFRVRSDTRAFAVSLRISALVLLAAFMYGVGGFIVLDSRDFHKEISVPEAVHRTIDQFDLTTTTNLQAHSPRARAFMQSLSVLSTVAVGYAFVSLFQPIRGRITDSAVGRRLAESLIATYPVSSEDYFKLWPHDKSYFFNADHTAGVAYGVRNGVALAVGEPMGDPECFASLLYQFDAFCETNDWQVAYVHVELHHAQLFKERDFTMQKIGEEAVVNIDTFLRKTAHAKYFRHIGNRFTKQGYTVECAQPPHSRALLTRLQSISEDWMQAPGRKERRFMMGSFSKEYLQQCMVVLLRDEAGTIQAFLNQVPTTLPGEANFDLLRHAHTAISNSNDFILMEWMKLLHDQGYATLNLGLCPLAGLGTTDETTSVTNNALRFLYANGDRFYSFSGLQRFKAKYEPAWRSRYIAYRGGIPSFTRVLTALNRAMKA